MNGNDIALPAFRPALRDVALAFALLTRLPLPFLTFSPGDPRPPAHAAWAYPLVGVFTGGLMAGVGWAAVALTLPTVAAALLALLAGTVVTGAMHEDGLADCADGFWGGWDAARRLEIMKDSQIGTYGVIALILSLGLRVIAMVALFDANTAAAALVGVAVMSRGMMVGVMYALPAVRAGGLSRQTGRPPAAALGGALGLSLMALFFVLPAPVLGAALIALLTAAGCAAVAKAKIGGQTGDVLGATQQITETALLLLCVATLA